MTFYMDAEAVTDVINWQNWRKPNKPHGLSGCFRLRNEAEFMRAAVLSHMPWLDEAVLVVQPSDDDTLALALDLADHDERIKVYYYPHSVDWIDTPGFYAKDPEAPGHLVHMSNFALSQCTYDWICKVEGDVICLSSFERIRRKIDEGHNLEYYGRVIVNLAGPDGDWYSHTTPRNGGFDEAVFANDPELWRFVRFAKWEQVQGYGRQVCMGWSGLHMKRCRERLLPAGVDWGKMMQVKGWNGETYHRYAPETLAASLHNYNRNHPYPGPDSPLGEPELFDEDWRQL